MLSYPVTRCDRTPTFAILLCRRLFVTTAAALVGLGILMVYSSSITAWPSHQNLRLLVRQLVALSVGGVLAGIAAQLPVAFWRRAAVPAYLLALFGLAVVLLPGVSPEINGAHRWFRVGHWGFQPSEFAKLALVLFLARTLEAKGAQIRKICSGWLPAMLAAAALSALILLEPDFGTAVFVAGLAVIMLFIAGVPVRQLTALALVLVPLGGALVLWQPYQMTRIKEFVHSWNDPSSAPYQVQQSTLAVGSGGLFGAGLGAGWQKFGFLPEANTDFVFAVIGEELGLLGTLTVLALWCLFLFCGAVLASQVAADSFAFLASTGLVVQIVLQAAINIGVVTASLPPKGIVLPFISYGGSSLLISLVSVGLILGLTHGPELGAVRK